MPASFDVSSRSAADRSYPRERYYRPELDLVRFLAFFLVFLHHNIKDDPNSFGRDVWWAYPMAAFSNACAFGLALFFTLSAFLICELLLREKQHSGTVRLSSFYVRRILRIWPLYFLGLAIGCLIALYRHETRDLALFGAYALMLGNWFNIFFHFTGNPMAVLWSISIEEQFYLVCPIAVRQFSRRGLYILCGAFLVVANFALLVLGNRGSSPLNVWFNSMVQFQFFAVGMLISLTLGGAAPKLSTPLRVAMIGASMPLLWGACYVFHALQAAPIRSAPQLMVGYALAAIACALIIVGSLGLPARVIPGWAVWLGKISFGLYVYHALAINVVSSLPPFFLTKGAVPFLLRFSAKLALTIIFAALSYRYFETFFLRLKGHFEVVRSRPI